METDRLKYFCAIVDTGSLTQASELLGVSHSGLSKAMAALQDDLGFKILVPKGRGLELTDRGKVLYEQSRKILDMMNSLKQPSPLSENILRVGFPEVLALSVTETLVRELDHGVTIEDLDSSEIEAQVLNRKSDFAFTFIPFPHKELEHLKVVTVALESFCRNGVFEAADPETIPYVIPASEMKDNALSIRIRDGWNSNLSRITPYRANSLSIALKMVQSGICAIYTPRFFVNYLNQSLPKDRQLKSLDLSPLRRHQERTERDIFLIKRKGDEETKAMKKVIRIVRQVCKNT